MIELDHVSQLRIKPDTRDTALCGRLHRRIGCSRAARIPKSPSL
jgi:hypothetical protein